MNITKPGWTTSEFWTTLIAQVISLITLIHPDSVVKVGDAGLVQAFSVIAAAIATAFYAHSRATVKSAIADNSTIVQDTLSTTPVLDVPKSIVVEGNEYLLAGLGATAVKPVPPTR